MSLSQAFAVLPLTQQPQGEPTRLPFGAWLPDLPVTWNPGSTVANNVVPHERGYKPLKSTQVFSDALTARCQGAFAAMDRSGNTHIYAGDATKLYRLVNTTWTDSTRSSGGAYATDADSRWEFIRWGNQVIATNYDDEVQVITMGGANFANLITSTDTPSGRNIAVIRNFVVLGHTNDEDGARPNRVRWSALEDATDFDESATTQSDKQDLESSSPGSQEIVRVVGREYGNIFQRNSIWRMTYVGSPLIFEFNEIETGRGALCAGSVVSWGRFDFYLAEDGAYVLDGDQSIPIGHNKVDRFFINDLDQGELDRVSSMVDPENAVVIWGYQSEGGGAGNPDKLLMYNWKTGNWSSGEEAHQFLFRSTSPGYTLDGLDSVSTDLDALALSLDSKFWQGGASLLSGFDASNRMVNFSGTAKDATLETAETQLFSGQKATIRKAKCLVDGGAQSIAIATRNRLADSVSMYGAAVPPNSEGECTFRQQRTRAQYHRFRVNITGDFTDAQGVEVEAVPSGWN